MAGVACLNDLHPLLYIIVIIILWYIVSHIYCYTVGGVSVLLNDLHAFDTSAAEWRTVTAADSDGPTPSPRSAVGGGVGGQNHRGGSLIKPQPPS